MTENFVIICTIGRTGSSLLINILNHLESTCFCGELIGENALLKLRNKEKITYEDLRISTYDSFHLKKINTRGNQYYCPKNCLFTKLTPNDISEKLLKANNAKDVLNTLLNSDSKTKGFKVLIGPYQLSKIINSSELKFCKFILLIRQNGLKESLIRGNFQIYENSNLAKESTEKYIQFYNENKNNKNIHLLSYEDITEKNENFKKIIQKIGCKYDEEKIELACKTKCSYNQRANLKI